MAEETIPIYWEMYRRELEGLASISTREEAAQEAVEMFIQGIIDDPGYIEDATVNGVVTPIVATRNSALKCKIKAVPGTDIHIGDIVNCLNYDWLVMDIYIDKVGIVNGTMWLCNDSLRFQNASETINVVPCVIDDGSYFNTLSSADVRVLTNSYKIYLSYDDVSKYLYVDKRLGLGVIYNSHGERALEAYKITGVDIKTGNFGEGTHLMTLHTQRDVYNAGTDSIDDGICDVFSAPEDEQSKTEVGSVVITGRQDIRLGTTRSFTAEFYRGTTRVEDAEASWTVSSTQTVDYVIEGNTVTIKIPLDEILVGTEITLTAKGVEDIYGNYEKKVRVINFG